MHILRHITILSILLLALAACSGETDVVGEKPQSSSSQASTPASGAADVAGERGIPSMDSEGLRQYLADNSGKATMVMIWATWCPSCKEQIPELVKLVETHGDKVNVLAMSLDDSKAALEKYLAKKPMNLPVVWGDQQIARDHNVEAIPTLLIFDKNGTKIFGQPGVYPHSMLGAMADRLAGE